MTARARKRLGSSAGLGACRLGRRVGCGRGSRSCGSPSPGKVRLRSMPGFRRPDLEGSGFRLPGWPRIGIGVSVPVRLYGTRVPFVNRGGRDFRGPEVERGRQGVTDAAGAARTRPLRADAQRNRARILEAAEVVFAAEGIEVPVDVIAEKAGVGVGTLYRHFPTKEKLCEADPAASGSPALTADAQALADAEDPAAAFFGFLEHVVRGGRGQARPHRRRHGRRTASSRLAAADGEGGPAARRSACCCSRAQAVGRRAPRRHRPRCRLLGRGDLPGGRAHGRATAVRPARHRVRRAAAAGPRADRAGGYRGSATYLARRLRAACSP